MGETELVSVPLSGDPAGVASGASISDDGRFVVFSSNSWNLVAGDTNIADDVFLRDRTLGSTTRVSVSSSGAETGAYGTFSGGGLISADGSLVAFTSTAADVVADDTNGSNDAFVHDRRCGNGALDGGEECDDGDHDSGDGCDADCTATGCGNGTVTAGEACDGGGDNGADGCCTASCTLVDADADGQCDAIDACLGDAVVRPTLVLKGANTGGANDRLTLRGKAPLSAPIDPMVDGLRVLIRDGLGRIVLDAQIPGGAGWSLVAPNNWRFLNPVPVSPFGSGEIKVSVRGDTARVKIRGDDGEYAFPPISPPLDAVLFFSELGGPCVQAHPECDVRAGGDKIACR
jgi:cysteine-rich repeat protein